MQNICVVTKGGTDLNRDLTIIILFQLSAVVYHSSEVATDGTQAVIWMCWATTKIMHLYLPPRRYFQKRTLIVTTVCYIILCNLDITNVRCIQDRKTVKFKFREEISQSGWNIEHGTEKTLSLQWELNPQAFVSLWPVYRSSWVQWFFFFFPRSLHTEYSIESYWAYFAKCPVYMWCVQ